MAYPGAVAARCHCSATVVIEGDAYNGTGLLAKGATVIVKGNAGMNTGSHLNGGTVVVHGDVGEFSGAYMKDGKLIFLSAWGFIGAGMEGGAIYSKSKAKTSPPAGKTRMKGRIVPLSGSSWIPAGLNQCSAISTKERKRRKST
ncbi:MAG: hypothetical protein R2741_14175 [Methanolobus sp.]